MRSEYYFCYNCGKNLHPVPLSTTVARQMGLYVGSILLAPMGLIWGMRYLRETSSKAKIIGVVCMTLTVITLVIMTKLASDFVYGASEMATKQLNAIQGF